jgi:hypothetical protein
MKSNFLALGALLLIAGCKPSESLPPVTTPAPTPTAVTTTRTNPTPPTPKPAKGDNPSRINQLSSLTVHTITAGGKKLNLWLMDNESKREEGMMFLTEKEVRNDQGMLFVFKDVQKDDGQHGFWMHNCPLGLDIVYISSDRKVVSVADGKPYDETSLSPKGDYQYVIEVKPGLAVTYGLKPGAKVDLGNVPVPTE